MCVGGGGGGGGSIFCVVLIADLLRHLCITAYTVLWYKKTTGTLNLRLRTDGDRFILLSVPISWVHNLALFMTWYNVI